MTNLSTIEGLMISHRAGQASAENGGDSAVVEFTSTDEATLGQIPPSQAGVEAVKPPHSVKTTSAEVPPKKRHLSEQLHSILLRDLGLESRDFSHERVARAMAALNAARAPLAPMVGEVLWLSPPIAFTLPGPYVYITRRFIERCTSDAPVAFLLAHEIAHHDLGHLKRAERWMDNAFARIPWLLARLAREGLVGWLFSRDNELAADAYALDLCRKAGFDLKRCLQWLDIVGWYLLDIHDLDGVYGTDEEIELDPDRASNAIGRMRIELRLWRARHRRSHPSLHGRRQILLSRIADIGRNDRSITKVTPALANPENHVVGAAAALWG